MPDEAPLGKEESRVSASSEDVATLPSDEEHRHQSRHVVHYLADHAKSAFVVAFMTLALGFSGKSFGPWGVWISTIIACFFVFLLAHDYSSERKLRFRSALKPCIPICFVLLMFAYCLALPTLLPITFSDDGDFSWISRRCIQLQLTKFHNYLKDAGFQLPDKLPVIQKSRDPMMLSVGPGSIGRSLSSPSYSSMELSAKDIGQSALIGYSMLCFRDLLLHPNGNTPNSISVPDVSFRMTLATILAPYFVSSYSGKLPVYGIPSQDQLLWELREKFGQKFTDLSISYAIEVLNESPLQDKDLIHFHNNFEKIFLAGTAILDPSQQKKLQIEHIFNAHPMLWGADSRK